MKFAPNVLAVICFFSLAISLQGQSSQTTGAYMDPSDSIYLQAVEILGFRPISESKERSRLTSMEIMSHDAGAILNRIPAVNGIRKGGGYGFDPVLRGFKYDQLGVLIDGIQTTTVACPNRMDPPTSQVSINALSGIEIHKGPYSLRYGNHIGGVINFQTARPVHHAENTVFSRISAGYESNGSIWRTEALAGVNSGNYDYQLTGSWHRGSDYRDGNGNLVPASFTRANLGMQAGFRPADNQEISLRVTRNFARNADYAALPMDLRKDDTWLIHLRHDLDLVPGNKLKISTSGYASLVDHLMDNYDKQSEPRMVNAETPVKTRNFGARTELRSDAGLRRFLTGVDFNFEHADGYRVREFLMGPNAGNTLTDNVWQSGRILKTGAFFVFSSRWNNLKYNVSGRLNLNTADAMTPDAEFSSLYETTRSIQVNPGITGGVAYDAGYFSYAVWAGRVQRSGNLSERFMNSFPVGLDPYELVGNPQLRPEVNNQADLILTFDSKKGTRIELDVFYAYLQDFISSSIRADLEPKMPSAPGVRQYDNIDAASITGAEMSILQQLPFQFEGRVDVAAQLGSNLVIGEPLPEIPPLDVRAGLHGSYLGNKLRPSLSARYVLDQSRISEAFGETETPSFWLMDLDVSYRAFKKFLISGGVRNLFDMAYYEHLNRSISRTGNPIYNPGRNIYLGITASF